MSRVALKWRERSPLDRALLAGFGVVALFNVVLTVWSFFPMPQVVHLGREANIPTYFHSAVLVAIALTFWTAMGLESGWRAVGRLRPSGSAIWFFGGAGFLYLALDEGLRIHERVAALTFKALGVWDRMTHYEITPAWWEALFAPLFGAIGVVVLTLLFRYRRRMRAFFVLGLVAMGFWGTALVLEFVQLTYLIGVQPWFGVAVFTEELFEMMGSSLFLLASVLLVRSFAGPPGLSPSHVERAAATA